MASFLTTQPRAMDSTEEMERIEMLLQYQHGFLISKVMVTACELGVFDLLLESGEPLSCTTIAERLGTSPTGMELLLGACVSLKLLRTERKDEKVFYANTELSRLYLGKSSPKSQYYQAMWLSEHTYLYLNYLTDAVRAGNSQLEKLADARSIYDIIYREGNSQLEKLADARSIYDIIYRSEEDIQMFMRYMDSIWSLWGRDVIAAFDLSQFPHICDLGGSSGALAKECISLYPNCTVTIFDLPEVVRTSKKYFVSEEEPRISFHEGDFFEDLIPEADLYILARVLHIWDDKKCVQLLTKMHKACKPGGGVLIIDMVLNEDRSGPLIVLLYSVIMLLHTEGKERSISEISMLLSAAGFTGIETKKPDGLFDVFLARK